MSILSVPIQYSLLHDQHLPPEWYNCYSWWAYIDTFLASKVHNFHQDSLTVVHGIDLDRFIITCVYHHSHARLRLHTFRLSSVQFSCSVVSDSWQPHGCRGMPDFPIHHQLPEFTQTHVHQVSGAIQPSHPLLSPFPPAFILSQNQGLLQWVSCLHQEAKVLEFQLQHRFSSVQFNRSVVSDSATPWTTAHQASLSVTNSWSLLRLMSNELVMPSNCLILCRPIFPPSIFPSIRVVSNESVLCIRWPKFGVSASTSVLPMNIQDWFSLGWTCWISLKFKALARIFFNPTVQKHQFFSVHLSLYPNSHPYMTTGKNHTFE